MSCIKLKKYKIGKENGLFPKKSLLQYTLFLCLLIFASHLNATTAPSKCSGSFSSKNLPVELSNGSVIQLSSISKTQLDAIYAQLTQLTAAFVNEPVSIAWGNPGGVYGPCAAKANIIRYYLATGKKHVPEFGFFEADTVAKKLETDTPKIASSLMIDLYALDGIRFDYEFVKPSADSYVTTGVRGKVSWGSHKAAVVNVEGELKVIDPLLEEPISIQKWIRTFVKRTREVPFLSKDQGQDLSVAIYEPRFREKLKGLKIGYTLSPEYSLQTANALDLAFTWRNQFQKKNPFSEKELNEAELDQLIPGLRLRVKRRE
jgi:hypothetical protein